MTLYNVVCIRSEMAAYGADGGDQQVWGEGGVASPYAEITGFDTVQYSVVS